jgi:hypothetical protein
MKYVWNLLIALDQFVNTVLLGDPDETVSSRAAKAAAKGKRWGCVLCRLLDYVQKDHCITSLEPLAGSRAIIPD